AAPMVSGTVALMLQANPGLTPPVIKAILQYTAQPLPGANVLVQGAGLLNVAGAVKVSAVLIPDIANKVGEGKLKVGDPILRSDRTFPAPSSLIQGATVRWSGFAFMGGDRVMSGAKLLTAYQATYDPRMRWVRQDVRTVLVGYFSGSDGPVEG